MGSFHFIFTFILIEIILVEKVKCEIFAQENPSKPVNPPKPVNPSKPVNPPVPVNPSYQQVKPSKSPKQLIGAR